MLVREGGFSAQAFGSGVALSARLEPWTLAYSGQVVLLAAACTCLLQFLYSTGWTHTDGGDAVQWSAIAAAFVVAKHYLQGDGEGSCGL